MTTNTASTGTGRLRRRPALAVMITASLTLAACNGGSATRRQTSPTTTPSSLPHPLPPGFAASHDATVAPPPGVLDVSPAATLRVADLHKAVLPRDEVTPIAQAIVNKALPTIVRPLLTDQQNIRPGQRVTVAAGDLANSAMHDALFILQGPGGRFQRLVQVKSGIAAGVVTLPANMTSGVWALAAEDLSQIRVARGQPPTGSVLLDLAIFTV